MGVEIIRAESADHFKAVAKLHAQGITEGFLSTLGEPFLSALYKGIARADGSGVLLGEDNGRILGFISYARDVKQCYKQVLKRCWPSLTVAMIPNVVKPSIYKKVFETLSYPRQQDQAGEDEGRGEIRPELLAMAVGPDARGLGVGKLLVKAVDDEMILMGLPGYFVVTHGVDERSNGFYQGRGFEKRREYVHHGKPMNEYYKVFSTLPSDSK